MRSALVKVFPHLMHLTVVFSGFDLFSCNTWYSSLPHPGQVMVIYLGWECIKVADQISTRRFIPTRRGIEKRAGFSIEPFAVKMCLWFTYIQFVMLYHLGRTM